jgi:hypothetical protein
MCATEHTDNELPGAYVRMFVCTVHVLGRAAAGPLRKLGRPVLGMREWFGTARYSAEVILFGDSSYAPIFGTADAQKVLPSDRKKSGKEQ